MQENKLKGTLYICPTPIGNLEDITLRCLRILKEVDLIAAEDTRISKKLLNHYLINTPLISYHKHSEAEKSDILVKKLLDGKDIALISDSGTPLISDPGNEIVNIAIEQSIKIVPLPGASSVTCAISASGIASDGFIFYGFLPRNKSKKEETLKKLSKNTLPIVFFESPQRVIQTLESIKETLGSIKIVIAREITKKFEEFLYKTVDEHLDYFKNTEPRGEFTIIIDKTTANNEKITENELRILIKELLEENNSISNIAKQLSKETGYKKNTIYKITLELTN